MIVLISRKQNTINLDLLLPILLLFPRGGGHPANNFFAIACVAAIVICVIFLFRREHLGGSWNDGKIPKHFKPTRENLFEVYIAAACAVILRDPKRVQGKFGFLSRSLREFFPDQHYDFSASYEFSLGTPVKIDSLSNWCNQYLSRDRKIHLLNFLAEIVVCDGNVEDQEKQFLYVLAGQLKLSTADLRKELFDSIYRQEQTQKRSTANSLSAYFRVLGLPDTAAEQDVKSAYRALVKITHPDRFMNETIEVQERMKKEFQQIQEAYENIMKKFD